MEKMILADLTEIEVQPGASLGENTVIVDTFAGLGTIAEALVKKGNLASVKYKADEQVNAEYKDMALVKPIFKSVTFTEEKKVAAVFGIREKTEMEKRMDKMEAGQNVQDGAIMELAGMVGGA